MVAAGAPAREAMRSASEEVAGERESPARIAGSGDLREERR
jgi:hypothetical protein